MTFVLSYPHFGPKNTLSNSYYFLILSKFTVFSTVLQLDTLLFQSFEFFCIKSYKRVFWSFPTKEPIFSPYSLSLSLFNLFAWIIRQILYKNHLSFASESVWVVSPQGHFSLFTSFEFWAERYFKIPHFW